MFLVNCIQAEWDPECITQEIDRLHHVQFMHLKDKVSKQLIGSWCSQEKIQLLMDLIVLTKPTTCVEIGAFTGSSVLPVAATLKYLQQGKLYAIDAWSNHEATKGMDASDPNQSWWTHLDMDSVFFQFKSLLDSWMLNQYCFIIQKASADAFDDVKETIDFLHLDGNYSEQIALQDVNLYLPKVKSGGYILLSNLFITINGKQPKKKAFQALYESCELIAVIDGENTVLFRKN
jgi:predicted O-methyltransferase YrrM